MRFGGRGGNILCGSLAQVCKVGSLRHLCSLEQEQSGDNDMTQNIIAATAPKGYILSM